MNEEQKRRFIDKLEHLRRLYALSHDTIDCAILMSQIEILEFLLEVL